MEKSIDQKTVVVLGLPRSGTSVTAGILEILGVTMRGSKIPQPVVPKGSFEDPDFVEMDKKILENLGGFWIFISQKEILALKPKFEKDIGKLIQDKSRGEKIWGWKHPATIRTIELYLPYLKNPHLIVVIRNEEEIVRSHQEFVKLQKISANTDKAYLLKVVKSHYKEVFAILKKYSDLPRIFVSFEDLINDPIKEAKRLADFLGLELTDEKKKKIKKFVIPRNKIEKERKKAALKSVLSKVPLFFKKCKKEPTKIPIFTWKALKLIKNLFMRLLLKNEKKVSKS